MIESESSESPQVHWLQKSQCYHSQSVSSVTSLFLVRLGKWQFFVAFFNFRHKSERKRPCSHSKCWTSEIWGHFCHQTHTDYVSRPLNQSQNVSCDCFGPKFVFWPPSFWRCKKILGLCKKKVNHMKNSSVDHQINRFPS